MRGTLEKRRQHRGLTLIELLVTLTIIGLLSTIAVNLYLQRLTLARVAAARADIDRMEAAVAMYRTDVGDLPPSGSGTNVAPSAPDPGSPAAGCGYLFLALTRSLNGDLNAPLSTHWRGPYIEFQNSKIGQLDGSPVTNLTPLPQFQMLDPWGNPYIYIRHDDYSGLGGTELPTSHPFAGTETWYNASGFQIISAGPNGATLAVPDRGLDIDDIANFKNN